jgi:uncharacterized protein YbgA (DUF1722 family)
VADAGKRDWDELTAEYGSMLMESLSVMGTRGKHVKVLQHLAVSSLELSRSAVIASRTSVADL